MTQALQDRRESETSEDEVTKRHLKFLAYMIELAAKDPDWNIQLKDMAEQFGAVEQ